MTESPTRAKATVPEPTPKYETGYFNTDSPITNRDEDRLNRTSFATRLAKIVTEQKDPQSIVIAIYGPYGEGKTSTLNLMKQELERHPEVIVIRFNPWHFSNQTDLLRSFFRTLADGLGKSLTSTTEDIGKLIATYGDILAPFKFVGFDASGAVKGIGKAVSTVELEEMRARVSKLLADSGRRIVIVIDDIDRLDRSEIQSILKLVKLSADFDYTAYILAFDKEMVAAAISESYGSDIAAGHSFLEKIIQVPLNLPPVDTNVLRSMVLSGVDTILNHEALKLTDDDTQRFVHLFDNGLRGFLKTPRMGKRYINALAFAVPLLKGEVDVVDLMLLEGIRVFCPHIYSAIASEPDFFLGSTSWADARNEEDEKNRQKKHFEGLLESLPLNQRKEMENLIKSLFPKTKWFLSNTHYGPDWDETWMQEKRLASSEYFPRYFQYAIPVGDLPDQIIENLLAVSTEITIQEFSEHLSKLLEHQRAERLIRKLRMYEQTIEPEKAKHLALAIAPLGGVLPNPNTLFPFRGPLSQSAILIANLIKRHSPLDIRDELAEQIISETKPVRFAIEILRWLRKTKDETEEERTISDKAENDLACSLANRVAEEAENHPPHLDDPRNAPMLFNIWHNKGDKTQLSQYLKSRFENDPTEAAKLITCFLPTAWGESGIPRTSELQREGYDSISQLIDAQEILNFLIKAYGDSIGDEKYKITSNTSLEIRAAHEFAQMHQVVQKSKEGNKLSNEHDKQPSSG